MELYVDGEPVHPLPDVLAGFLFPDPSIATHKIDVVAEVWVDFLQLCEEHADSEPLRQAFIPTPIDSARPTVAANGGLPSDDARLARLLASGRCHVLFDMLKLAAALGHFRAEFVLITMIAVAAETLSVPDLRQLFQVTVDSAEDRALRMEFGGKN